MAGILTCSPFVLPSHPGKTEQWLKEFEHRLQSLQLRDSPGFTPGSLLIFYLKQAKEPKAVQK